MGGIGRAARLGAIIKGGLYLETLGRVDTIILDKTGTLTFGKSEVQTVVPVDGLAHSVVLDTAATAELRSEHPLGKAIVAYAQSAGRTVLEPEHFDYTPGRGIVARSCGTVLLVGNQELMDEHGVAVPPTLSAGMDTVSEILVARDDRLLGGIAVADTIRPEARNAGSGACPHAHAHDPAHRRYEGSRRRGRTHPRHRRGICSPRISLRA